MHDVGKSKDEWPQCAVVLGASGGIGAALCEALAQRGVPKIYAGSRSGDNPAGTASTPFAFDLTSEQSIANAAELCRADQPDCVIVATGVLTLADGSGPERSYRKLDAETMTQVLHLNTIGPAIIAKHFLPLLPRDRRSVFTALSARVGSIGDNGLGGWHSYRASKAALNMLLKNLAIELGRTHKQAIVAGLHPGTVDSALSEPFQKGLPEGQLTSPADAAASLLTVLSELSTKDSGGVFDFAGKRLPA